MSTAAEKIVQRDALEFGAHTGPNTKWRLALLVARNVQSGARPAKKLIDNKLSVSLDTKVSSGEFAALSGVSRITINWFLKAWDAAAKDGVVPTSKKLKPGDEVELPSTGLWTKYYNLARPKPSAPAAPPADTEEEADAVSTPQRAPEPEAPKVNAAGAAVKAKARRLAEVKANTPDSTKDAWAKDAGLAGHQEVRYFELLLAAPQEYQELVYTGQLKRGVSQEILEAPLLESDEQLALAAKFVAGTISQTGQASGVIRPIVAFTQSARPAMREAFLGDLAMTVEQAQALYPVAPRPEPTFDPTSALKWASNFHTSMTQQTQKDQAALDRLVQAEPAADMMLAMDQYLMSQVVREMQQQRESLMARFERLEWWIDTLGGQVNHPQEKNTKRPTIIDAEPFDAEPRNVINISSKRA